jgi:cytochrome c oxidase cbb3-type subunit III
MSSLSRRISLSLALAISGISGAGAQDVSHAPPREVTSSGLFPAEGRPPPQDPHDGPFRSAPLTLADGKRVFTWYNCGGCHFNGGGGIGPALSDYEWIYGNRIDQVFASIERGRPNGMPAWRGKIPNAQIWSLSAYVLSLGPQPTPPGGTQPKR